MPKSHMSAEVQTDSAVQSDVEGVVAPSETATVGDVVDSPESSTVLTGSDLADIFARSDSDDGVAEEESSVSVEQDEKPADEPAEETVVEQEEVPEEETEPEEEVEEVASEETEETEKPTTRPWYRKRIDELTALNDKAVERISALESRLEQQVQEQPPADSVELITDPRELTKLEQRALDAEDEIDELLEQEPKYDDDGNPYWKVGDNQLDRKQLLEIRKKARLAYRSIPQRRQVLERKAQADAALEKSPYFDEITDPEGEYYDMLQKSLQNDFSKRLEAEFPEARAAIYLMVEGQRSVDEKRRKKEKASAPKKKPVIKPTPTSKAATDTAVTPPPTTPERSERKQKDKILSSGNVSSEQAATLFM